MTTEGTTATDITSLSSVPVTNCNVPDPRSIEAEFVYNFYVQKEDVDYTPQPTTPIDYSGGLIDRENIDRIEARERGSLTARVPRYIKLRISPFLNGIPALEPGELSSDVIQLLQAQSGGNTSYSAESEVENPYNARVTVVDSAARRRVQSEIYRIANSLIEAQTPTSEYSDQMIAMTLNGMLSDDIDAAIILDALSDNEIKGYKFVNQISSGRYSRFAVREKTRFMSKINAGGYRDLTSSIVTSNPFSRNFLPDLFGTSGPPSSRNWILDSSLFATYTGPGTSDLENLLPRLSIIDVSEERLIESRTALANLGYPTIRHAGYVIEKIATAPDGAQERFNDIVSLNPRVTEFIDPLVKYGYTYTYRARQLYVAKIIDVTDLEPYQYQVVTVALASSAPSPAIVKAIEETPPRPPGTLICSFIYKAGNGIRLDWSRPTNPTRDIRKYQVFRRKSFLEPYQLIAEYDFTDPDYTQFMQRESIDPSLVRKSSIPVLSHIDHEFTRASSYMYCVASVDAHGLTSGYGTQVLATFDRFSNTLNTRIVSQAGAPKAYPNYYIDPTELEEFGSDRLVEDVIKDSGHGRMRIYFNPDAYRVASDEDGTETQPIVLSSERGIYKFQVINLDRQISKILTVSVDKDRSLDGIL